ncbi:hypothetical protein G5I_06592 [Acromyrmex echinatior]|uniref:Uncharacterized protein n=1 Tax=Acromyrmex echinatior TaxID=103372 RepID=F4WLG5_ACREC|nr:hypothetical protein G5I_06592 [Acromyrmex echinatior]
MKLVASFVFAEGNQDTECREFLSNLETAVVPVIRRNERLIITKNYVSPDERIVLRGYYLAPRSAYSPRRQEEELRAGTHHMLHIFTCPACEGLLLSTNGVCRRWATAREWDVVCEEKAKGQLRKARRGNLKLDPDACQKEGRPYYVSGNRGLRPSGLKDKPRGGRQTETRRGWRK